jgi:diguanylate cyclase (GGDEF)-like protein
MIPPLAPTELLVAVADGTTMAQVAETGPGGEGPGCPVAASGDCQAIQRGRVMRFEADDALDACPHLHDRLSGPCAAACVPVRVLGQPIGVLHRTKPVGDAPDDIEIGYLESLATKLETRLSLRRVSAPAGLPTLDPVTGMFSRESVEAKILGLARSLTPFSLAQCGIDHFADYVDAHGPEAGERALRKVGQAMMGVLRPSDVVGRCGIDELLVVFPNTGGPDASGALERVREHLALSLALDGTPPFTCSFGVVESGFGRSLDELLVEADVAVSLAKDLGRNRVVIAGELVADPLLDDD